MTTQSQPAKPTPGWMMKDQNGNTYGPFPSELLIKYAKENRIARESLLMHPKITAGKYVPAGQLKGIAEHIPAPTPAPTPTPPPAEELNYFSPPEIPKYQQEEASSGSLNSIVQNAKRRQTRLRSAPPKGFVGFFIGFCDPTFKYYVTPIIIRITWTILLAVAILLFSILVFTVIGNELSQILPEGAKNQGGGGRNPFNRDESMSAFQTLARLLTRPYSVIFEVALFLFLWLLQMRMILEFFIVLFDISENVKTIASEQK